MVVLVLCSPADWSREPSPLVVALPAAVVNKELRWTQEMWKEVREEQGKATEPRPQSAQGQSHSLNPAGLAPSLCCGQAEQGGKCHLGSHLKEFLQAVGFYYKQSSNGVISVSVCGGRVGVGREAGLEWHRACPCDLFLLPEPGQPPWVEALRTLLLLLLERILCPA